MYNCENLIEQVFQIQLSSVCWWHCWTSARPVEVVKTLVQTFSCSVASSSGSSVNRLQYPIIKVISTFRSWSHDHSSCVLLCVVCWIFSRSSMSFTHSWCRCSFTCAFRAETKLLQINVTYTRSLFWWWWRRGQVFILHKKQSSGVFSMNFHAFFFFTCFKCLDDPVLLLREWPGLNVLAGDLSRKLMTDWLLLTGGGHTWGSMGATWRGKFCMMTNYLQL